MVNIEKIEDIIKKILNEPIPDEGKLINPLENAKHKNRQTKMQDIIFPANIKEWTLRVFVDYFAFKYQENFDSNYRKMYRADTFIIQKAWDYFKINALNYKLHTKNLIDWAFKNKEHILKTEGGHFTTQQVINKINFYYQEEVMPKIETGIIERKFIDTSLIEEIQKADNEGKYTEIFARFGIPIAITYLVIEKKLEESTLLETLEKRIELLYKGSPNDREKLDRMLRSSVTRSPYPEEFYGLNWRNKYESKIYIYKQEIWWRDTDYHGKIPEEYYLILRGEKND